MQDLLVCLLNTGMFRSKDGILHDCGWRQSQEKTYAAKTNSIDPDAFWLSVNGLPGDFAPPKAASS